MTTKSALLPSIGALLALLLFVALPSPARANLGQCPDVDIEWYYGGGNQIYFELVVGDGCDIYVTNSVNNPNFAYPSRSGATPISPTIKVASGSTFYVPYGSTMYIRAFAFKPLWSQSVNLSEAEQHNPNL
jgi:hypothetical protein